MTSPGINGGSSMGPNGFPTNAATLIPVANTYTPNAAADGLVILNQPTANFTLANPAGSVKDGQRLLVRIPSGATGFTPTFGNTYASSGLYILPIAALPNSKTVTLGFVYDAGVAKWILLAADLTGY